MTMPIWALIMLRWLLAASLCISGVSGAIALSLSFAGPRERHLARRLWPVAGISLWAVVCLFMIAALTNWPGPPQAVPISRLAMPAVLAALGGLLGAYWVRWAVKGRRSSSAHAGVAA
jgi:CBS-domain-containing membrane protein